MANEFVARNGLIAQANSEITGSLKVTAGITGSFSGTASYADNANLLDGIDSTRFATTGSNTFTGNQIITGSIFLTGSLTSTGTITAQRLVVQSVTSSIVYSSGSNIFGNDINNTQVFTGSVLVTGSLSVNGSRVILSNQTSSMSASYSVNSTSASYALNTTSASYSVNARSASYSVNSTSASYASNADLLDGLNSTAFVLNSQTSSMSVLTAASASNITNAITNAADNRVLTANGGGTINGEANLTFNGSNLILAPGTNGVTTGLYINGGDITAARSSTTGVIYFGSGGGPFLYYDGSSYTFGAGSTGYVQNDASFRAPIFYDRDNTAYYVDAASTSSLYYASFANDVQMNGNYLRFDQSGTRSWNQRATGGNLVLNSGDGNGAFVVTVNSGMYSQIYYDYNNSGYYVDPASTSNLNVLNIYGQKTLSVVGGNTITGDINALWGLVKVAGNKLYTDDQFNDGTNGISVYNNAGGSAVTITRKNSSFAEAAASPMPNSSGYVLEIRHAPGESSGTAPGYGGFYFATSTSPGSKRMVCIFKMKVPSGRTIEFASNSIGTNGTNAWLTSNAGTGLYQDYAFLVHSGTATFSSTFFFYISGGASSTFYTYLASATVYEVTDLNNETVRVYNASAAMYAPIYYDSNDTGYYLDPAGSSVLNGQVVIKGNDNQLVIDGTTGGGVAGIFFRQSGANKYELYQVSSELRIYNYTTNQIEMSVASSGFITARTSFRAPIFYDSDDTAYYIDAASTSYVSTIYGVNIRTTNAFYLGTNNYYFNNTNDGWYSNVKVQSAADMRAPIFYDLDNTAYYVNPNGSSNLLDVTINALGVGTAAPGTAGLIRATNDVVAYYSSDRRLKDNIKLIKNPLEKISKIGGYEFDWNDKQEVYEGHDIGIIAQEIEEILPEIVTTRDSGYKAVKYEKIVPLLIEGIKEQQQQINELKELVNKLINK